MPELDIFNLNFLGNLIRRWWWLIAICTLLSAAVAYKVAERIPPVYQANLTLLVESSKEAAAIDYSSLVAGERLALTYSQMLKSPTFLEEVIHQLDLSVSPGRLAGRITANPIKDTQLILLSVEDTSPEQAALVANTLADVFTSQIQARETSRYTDSLASLQEKMSASLASAEETQSNIDNLNKKKSEVEAELSSISNTLEDDRANYQLLQQDAQDLQSIIDQLMSFIKIIEPAKVPEGQRSPYTASVTLLIGQNPASDSRITQVNEQFVSTYAEMLSGQPVIEAAIQKIGLEDSPDKIAKKITVAVVPNTQLLRLNIWDSDPAKAILLASTIADEFIIKVQDLLAQPYYISLTSIQSEMEVLSQKIEELQANFENLTIDNNQYAAELTRLNNLLTESRSDYRSQEKDYEQLRLDAAGLAQIVSIAEPAQIPTKPTMNTALIYTILTGAIVAFLSSGLALFLELQNDTLRTKEDISKVIGMQTLSSINLIPKPTTGSAIVSNPVSSEIEDFRLLATNLRYASLEKPLKTLLVTSPAPQEGKSLIVANLAAALARSGFKVIAVDADLRIPRLHRYFELEQGRGLTDSLLDGNLDGNLRQVGVEGLEILTCGKLPSNPAEVINSSNMQFLLTELEKKADWVLIDCPPLLPISDSLVLAPLVNGVLLVIRSGQTRGHAAREAVESLRKVNAHLVGIILNAAPKSNKGYYHYQYHENGSNNNKPIKNHKGTPKTINNMSRRN